MVLRPMHGKGVFVIIYKYTVFEQGSKVCGTGTCDVAMAVCLLSSD